MSYHPESFENLEGFSGFERLGNEIILRAIVDYKAIKSGRKIEEKGFNIAEIKDFFLGGFCDLLLTGTDLTGEFLFKSINEEFEKGKEAKNE